MMYLIDLLKKIFFNKFVLAVLSFAGFTYLFTWKFAALLMLMIGIHERGHIWAAGKYGAKSGGFYFVPFLGGAATIELKSLPSRWSENFVAIMGPIWGFGVALVWAGIYLATNNPFWAFAAYWGAMFNLFNLLLPIHPLDGGRIVKSWLSSLNPWLGLYYSFSTIFISLGIWLLTGHPIFLFIAFLGWGDYMYCKKNETFVLKSELPKELQAIKDEWVKFEKNMAESPVGENTYEKTKVLWEKILLEKRVPSETELQWLEFKSDIEDKEELCAKIMATPDVKAMNMMQICLAIAWYAATVLVMILLMIYMYEVPGWDAGMAELLGSAIK